MVSYFEDIPYEMEEAALLDRAGRLRALWHVILPQVRGGILFLEDVGEHPYRIERMLGQLLPAGVLDAQAAVLIGYVNRYRLVERDAGFDMPVVIRRLRSLTRTPILTGLPVGHDSPKLTLPHGARVGLATEGRTAYLVLHEH